jgi:alpha-glucosidase
MNIKHTIATRQNKRWPEGAIVYQIYPRSFYDSNADGIGDIPGVTKKLGYLKDLGVTAIWLSPFYTSPMADFGYDVADYCGVDPIFGTLSDMDTLIKQAHRKNIKILVDFIPNHSSDEHQWFRQSRQSRENEYSDWYIWKDPKGKDSAGKPIPPNNWLDIFTGKSAWEWEPARQQFYLHSFDVHQPDLNWANPGVREGIKSAMRFWLDKGVDGFRVDAVRFMGKDPMFKDNPKNRRFKASSGGNMYGSIIHSNSQGWPQLYDYLNEMAAVLKEKPYLKPLRFMVTESYPDTNEPVKEYLAYYKGMDPQVAAPFNFEGLGLSWQAEPWRNFLGSFHMALETFNPLSVASYAFGNHDQHRLATRLGDTAARSAALLLLTLPGMSFIYNGEEIGMTNGHIPPEMVQDPAAIGGAGRDPERTPMQWSAQKHAGFSTADKTWLPVNKDYIERNVTLQRKDKKSFLSLYRKLTRLRLSSDAMRQGSFEIIDVNNEEVLAFRRFKANKSHLVLINFTELPQSVRIPKNLKAIRVLVSSDPHSLTKRVKNHVLHLSPSEAVVL